METQETVQPISSAQDEVTAAKGLTSEEAEARFRQLGPNDPALSKRHSPARELLRLFLNPLVMILPAAAAVSAMVGESVDAGIIVVIVLLSVAVDFGQTHRSQGAIERLRERVEPTASVLRDGQWQEIRRSLVVPGDVVRLSAGDLVPADARLLVSRDLYIQQAALTGESMPAEKQAGGTETSARPETINMVFLGTSVVSGTATALVVATGSRTL
jgi:Mg2+-importing ATPase